MLRPPRPTSSAEKRTISTVIRSASGAAHFGRGQFGMHVRRRRLGHIVAATLLGRLVAHHPQHVVERSLAGCLDFSEEYLCFLFLEPGLRPAPTRAHLISSD